MRLLTKEIEKQFPEWMSSDGSKPEDVKIIAKFFLPGTGWTWYATEYDGEDTFFGYVVGLANEYGYFSLSELEEIVLKGMYRVERDLYYNGTMADVLREHS